MEWCVEETLAYRRVDNGAFSPVRPLNALLYRAGVCDEVVHTLRTCEIPPSQTPQVFLHRTLQYLGDMEILEVLRFHFPCVAHRGVTVADVHGGGWGDYSLADGMGGAQNHIEMTQIDVLHGLGHPREEKPVRMQQIVCVLQAAGVYVRSIERAYVSMVGNCGEEGSFRP